MMATQAAQAIEHGYTLLTLNEGDFADLPGLQLRNLTPRVQA
jgi:predicted nucleic acid-binding protein